MAKHHTGVRFFIVQGVRSIPSENYKFKIDTKFQYNNTYLSLSHFHLWPIFPFFHFSFFHFFLFFFFKLLVYFIKSKITHYISRFSQLVICGLGFGSLWARHKLLNLCKMNLAQWYWHTLRRGPRFDPHFIGAASLFWYRILRIPLPTWALHPFRSRMS